MADLNLWAVLVAAVSGFVLGGLWYSPVLFGRAWQREAGLSDEQLKGTNMVFVFGLSFVHRVIRVRDVPRPAAALGAGIGRRFFRRLVLGGCELRHQLLVRAQVAEIVRHQRGLPHLAVHPDRLDPRTLASKGSGRIAYPSSRRRRPGSAQLAKPFIWRTANARSRPIGAAVAMNSFARRRPAFRGNGSSAHAGSR